MPIPLIDVLSRQNDGNFPLLVNTDCQGGWMTVADNTARDAIISAVRVEGMHVWSVGAATLYRLEADLVTWVIEGAFGVSPIFIFQPGGTPGVNVYTDWPTLVAALSTVAGPKEIAFDNTFAPCNIPAGGPYDMLGVRWSAAVSPAPTVTLLDGATFVNLRTINGVGITNANTATPAEVITNTVASEIIRLVDVGLIYSVGGQPVWRHAAGSTRPLVLVADGTTLFTDTVDQQATGSGARLQVQGTTLGLQNVAITSLAATFVRLRYGYASSGPVTFPGVLGTLEIFSDRFWGLSKLPIAGDATAALSTGGAQPITFNMYATLNVAGGAVNQSLPPLSSAQFTLPGSLLLVREVSGTSGLTLARSGTDSILSGGISVTTLAVPAGGAVLLASDGISRWDVVGLYAPQGSDAPLSYLDPNTASAPQAVSLPASPALNERVVVTDIAGNAAANNITVSGSGGKLINGVASDAVFNVNYESRTYRYNGTQWNRVARSV